MTVLEFPNRPLAADNVSIIGRAWAAASDDLRDAAHRATRENPVQVIVPMYAPYVIDPALVFADCAPTIPLATVLFWYEGDVRMSIVRRPDRE